jgi:hypothetical protein
VGNTGLRTGQALDTGDGYAEVLLTPGAFLRVGHNSQVRLISAGLADTRFELVRGSASVEVDQLIKGTNLAIVMNGGTTQIQKKGVYGFDAEQQTVRVMDGKATVVTAAGSKNLGKHDQLWLSSADPLKKRSFDNKVIEAEPLYVWSKARSADLAQLSYNTASAGNYASAGTGWFWNPYALSYGFWPIGGSLYSPFGLGFYSPASFGYYGGFGGYYPRAGWYARPHWQGRPGGWHGRPGMGHERMGGVNARIGSAPRAARPSSGFRGNGGGFHGAPRSAGSRR